MCSMEPRSRMHGLKVKHLPMTISRQEVKEMFANFGEIASIRLHYDSQEAYAFVNYYWHAEATRAAQCLNGTKMDGKRVTVKLQRQFGPYPTGWQRSIYSPCYSALDTRFIAKPGHMAPWSRQPPLFSNAGSFHSLVPASSMASVKKRSQPFKHEVDVQVQLSNTVQLLSLCEPLTTRLLTTFYKDKVNQLASQHNVVVEKLGNEKGIIIRGNDTRMVRLVKARITALKVKVEEECSSHADLALHCMYVPLLRRLDTISGIKRIEERNGVEFYLNKSPGTGGFVLLATFASNLIADLPKISDISGFCSTNATTQQTPTWLFQDDQGHFVPYSPADAAEVEKMYQADLPTSLKINRFTYTFSFTPETMTQANTHTNRKRRIQREIKITSAPGEQCIMLQVHGVQAHLEEAWDELVQELDKNLTSCHVDLPPTFDPSLHKQLLDSISQYLVKVEVADNEINLKGARGHVDRVELLLRKQLPTHKESDTPKPGHWELSENDIELKPVVPHSSEWKEVTDLMLKTIPGVQVQNIERVQNAWLWDNYCVEKRQMSRKNGGIINEKQLFHGTKFTEPQCIYKSKIGFDFRCAKRQGVWGEGTYFAVNAMYSARSYAYRTGQYKQIFLADVLTGETYLCPPYCTLKKPPPKPSGDDYDSVSGQSGDSDIFVIYNWRQAYPAYLITFSD